MSNFNLDDLDLGGIHGYQSINERNNGNENVPDSRIGNKKHRISKLQRRMKADGSTMAIGSDDFGKDSLSEMNNVNRRGQQL